MSHKKEILQSMSERLASSANVKQVFGEPIQAGGKTVVPVARVHYRLGGGWGGGEHGSGAAEHPLAAGAGGGGGLVTASPVGALEISDAGVRFVHFFDPADVAKLCVAGATALLVLGRVFGRRK